MDSIDHISNGGKSNAVAVQFAHLLPALVLSGWGAVMVHAWVTGRTKTLLHPFFQPLIAVAGVILLALALAHVFYAVPARSPSPRRTAQWLLLLIPLLLAALLAPRSFSDQMVAARGIQSTSNVLDPGILDANAEHLLANLAGGDPHQALPIDVVDLVTASGVSALTQKLEGRTLRLRGQYYKINSSDFKVLRLLMYCCAADATPVGVLVHGQVPGDLKNMDWIELEGTVHFIQSLGQVHPEVDLKLLHAVKTPDNPYAN
jgi:uncharacterized repeat protein (TIGR03943 family)